MKNVNELIHDVNKHFLLVMVIFHIEQKKICKTVIYCCFTCFFFKEWLYEKMFFVSLAKFLKIVVSIFIKINVNIKPN